MLIIAEGLDKSGKSMLVNILHQSMPSLLIRKQYDKNLYPISYTLASEYDWQAMLDRIVLANPDVTFIADRSFFTQTVYQLALGTGINSITDGQLNMFNNYCKVVKEIPHLLLYCSSNRIEFDSMVTNMMIRSKLDKLYRQTIIDSGLTTMFVNTGNALLADNCNNIIKKVNEIINTKAI